jgi:hypothetical protein
MAWLAHLARNILHDEPSDNPLLTPVTADLIRKVSVIVGPSDIVLPCLVLSAVATQVPKE